MSITYPFTELPDMNDVCVLVNNKHVNADQIAQMETKYPRLSLFSYSIFITLSDKRSFLSGVAYNLLFSHTCET